MSSVSSSRARGARYVSIVVLWIPTNGFLWAAWAFDGPGPGGIDRLFPALENRAPVSAFASRGKGEVFGDGSVQQLLYPSELKGCCVKERTEGARLRFELAGHSTEAARVQQQYTPDAAPTVETMLSWADAKLILTTFAAEPEQHGFYVRAELVNRSTGPKDFALDLKLENVKVHLREGAGLAGENGDILLEEVPVSHGMKTGRWAPFATPHAGLRFSVSLKPGDQYVLAVAMPPAGRSGLPSFVAARQATNLIWKQRFEGAMEISVPDQRMQLSWEANRKQLGVYLEPRTDGLRVLAGFNQFYGSCPYSTLQATMALDQLGLHDTAQLLLRRQLKRVRPDGIFEMWEKDLPPSGEVEQWIVQGLAPLAFWKHYEYTHDREWLRETWPVVLRAAEASREARRGPKSSGSQGRIAIRGFVPPGFGDGGIPLGYTLPQNFGPLTGIWVALQMAKALGLPEQAWLRAAYDDYKSSIIQVMRASTVVTKGLRVVPSYPGAESPDAFEHLWGTAEAVYPLEQIGCDDPLVLGTLRFLQSELIHGLHLHLGYSRGVWPYYSASLAHWHLRLGEYAEAFRIQQAILDHASPTWGWYEEYERQPLKPTNGIPQLWPSAECLLLTRELLLLEKGGQLLLGPAIPISWAQAGREVEVRNGATPLGGCSYRMQWDQSEARGWVRLPGSRWRTIWIKLLPARVSAPRIAVTGARLEGISGRFVILSGTSSTIELKASW